MRYFLDPFGCAKNQVDAEMMEARLNGAGWDSCGNADEADLIIVNSCGFIEAAKQESINAVIAWRRQYPEKKILLAGCLAQRYGKELAESLTEADGFFGNTSLDGIAEKAAALAAGAETPGKPSVKTPLIKGSRAFTDVPEAGNRPLLGFPGTAYVKISEGCNNRCSFCAIPLIRGGLRCRPVQSTLKECKTLLERGAKELCIIGQDIASYKPSLGELLRGISELSGSFWVRLLYLHPDHFPPDILDILERDRRFLPYFDIPFQHASPATLAAMNRQGNASAYLKLLDRIRGRLPDAVIRSTFLVGFPGETEEDLSLLLDFQQKACFDWLGVFVYSREEGTPAWSMKNQIGKKTAADRKARIEAAQVTVTEERMNRFVGRTMDVLVEESLEEPAGNIFLGRLFCHAPEVDGAVIITGHTERLAPGTLVTGKVFARTGFDLEIQV